MNNVLTTIAAFMILILTALFTIPLLINWDDYRADFEVRLSEIVGSKVELDGSLNVRLLPAPFVSAENLRIGESGQRGKPVLEVKELTLWVAVPPLLKGVIEASTVTLDSPRLHLQFDEKGRPSFDVGTKRSGAKKPAKRKTSARDVGGSVKEASLSGFELSPNLISLRNVKIKNGHMILQSAPKVRGKKKTKAATKSKIREIEVKNIDGVLSAITLEGPFYFNGKYLSKDVPHFVRLAVGELSKESATNKKLQKAVFPVQGKITVPKNDQQIEFEGRVGSNSGAWFASGALKAGFGRVGVADLQLSKTDDITSSTDADTKLKKADSTKIGLPEGDKIFLTSKVEIASTTAKLNDILVRSGSLARPQTIRGQVTIDWRDELNLSGSADGQVVDLNVLLGSSAVFPDVKKKAYVAPGVGLSKLNDFLLVQAKFFERMDFSAKVKQIYLGRGDVRDFNLLVKGRDGQIRIEDLAGRLAGSSRVSVSGEFTEKNSVPLFTGQLYLRGLQFQEFMNWAVPSYETNLKFGRGKYILSGSIVSEGDTVLLNGLQGNFGSSSLRGDVSYRNQSSNTSSSELRVALRAGSLDIEDLLGKPVALKEFESEFSKFFGKNNSVKPGADNVANSTDLNTVFELAAHRIVFKDSVQKDVHMIWRDRAAGAFVERLSGTSEDGLKLVYENGKADALGEDKFLIQAKNERALKGLLDFSGLDESVQISKALTARLFPLNLALRREVTPEFSHYRFDGQMGGNDTAFSVFIPLEGAKKNTGVMTVIGGMENQNGALLATKLLPFGFENKVSDRELGPAKLSFSATGTLDSGFNGQVKLENDVISASYEGHFSLGKEEIASEGELLFSGDNSTDVLAVFGLGHLSALNSKDGKPAPFRAKGKFSQIVNGFALNELRVAVGDRQLVGTGLFEEKEGKQVYRLALGTDQLDLQTLLAGLQKQVSLDGKRREVRVANLGETKTDTDGRDILLRPVWSDVPFTISKKADGDAFGQKSVLGDFSIQVGELKLSEQLSISDAIIQWRAHPSHIEIIKIEGKSLGGVFKASGILRESNGAYNLSGLVTLDKARLEDIGAAEEANIGSGEFSLNLSLSGSGSSPKDLVSSLIGEGFLKISDGSLRQVNPALLTSLAERFLKSESGDAAQLKTDLLSLVEKIEPLKISNIDLALQMLDGAVKLRQKDLGVRPGKIGLQAEFRLVDLSWQGNWTITPTARKAVGPVPSVRRKIKGDFTSVAGISSQLEIGEFERYLTLKHKEKELRSLEKIRLDEEQHRLTEQRREAETELKRIREEKARLKREQEQFDDLNRTELPPL